MGYVFLGSGSDAEGIAVAVAAPFGEGSLAAQGGYKSLSHVDLYAAIGAYLAPDDPPPAPGT